MAGRPPPGSRKRRIPRRGCGALTAGPGLLARGQLGGALGDRRLAVGGLVLVDDALARGLVELTGGSPLQRNGRLDVALLGGLAELADGRLERRLDGLVAQAALLVLPVALDLGLDVRHEEASVKV